MGEAQIGEWDFREGRSNSEVSLADKMGMVGKLASLSGRMAMWGAGNLMGNAKGTPFHEELMPRAMGFVTKSMSIAQIRMLTPIRPARLELKDHDKEAAARGLANYNGMLVGDGFSARWIHEVPDRQLNDPVLFYLHGGGYALKVAAPQIQFVLWMADKLKSRRVSILLLDYTVTPFAKYPEQLVEAVRCYNVLAHSCRQIILFGESCGGNLSMAILAHQRHPVKDIPPLANIPVWGLALVSPWFTLNSDPKVHKSFSENQESDIIDGPSLEEMATSFCEPEQRKDPVANPLEGDAAYWQACIPVQSLAVWGEKEVLRDSCREFCERVGIVNCLEESGGVHDCMLHSHKRPAARYLVNGIGSWIDNLSRMGSVVSMSSPGQSDAEILPAKKMADVKESVQTGQSI